MAAFGVSNGGIQMKKSLMRRIRACFVGSAYVFCFTHYSSGLVLVEGAVGVTLLIVYHMHAQGLHYILIIHFIHFF